MATQLNMFEGVQGNVIGESFSNPLQVSEQACEIDFLANSADGESNEPILPNVGVFPVVEELDDSLAREQLLPPSSNQSRCLPESNVSPAHANPYDPVSNASVWARIRAFFLQGFHE